MNESDRNGGKVMRRKLLPLAAAAVLACVSTATALAAGSTHVTQFSYTTPPHLTCGILGSAVVHGTNVFRDTGDGTSFMSGTWFGVFTAANTGKSTTLSFAGPVTQASPPVIDQLAGTVTITTTDGGLFRSVAAGGSQSLLPARRGTRAGALRRARAASRGPPRRDAEPLWRVERRRGPGR